MANPDDLFGDLAPPPTRIEQPPTTTTPNRSPCHFAKAFARDQKRCEQRWGDSTEYYCGPCRQANQIR